MKVIASADEDVVDFILTVPGKEFRDALEQGNWAYYIVSKFLDGLEKDFKPWIEQRYRDADAVKTVVVR